MVYIFQKAAMQIEMTKRFDNSQMRSRADRKELG